MCLISSKKCYIIFIYTNLSVIKYTVGTSFDESYNILNIFIQITIVTSKKY